VFARAIVATGARAAMPPVVGLAELAPLTNETVFSLTELPRRLLVLGGGPIGCELAQAFRRFGSEVTLVDRDDRVLPREDRDASAIVSAQLECEGVQLVLGAVVTGASRTGDTCTLTYERAGTTERWSGDHVLVAAGRTPNLGGLDVAAAGVDASSPRGMSRRASSSRTPRMPWRASRSRTRCSSGASAPRR